MLPAAIVAAEKRMRPFVKETPLELSHILSDEQRQVYLKLENLQHTGSFKLRGAINKLLSLSEAERSRGIVTASTGNHGAATAYSLKKLGIKGIVFVPENASPAKLAAIKSWGAEVRTYGNDGVISERQARSYAAAHRMTYISPYNDLDVVAGQGSIGVELVRQLGQVDHVLIALGGGGLLSGVSSYLRHINPAVNVIACCPENSAVMLESLKAGKILDLPSLPTLSDGTAGGVEADALTFDLCQSLISDSIRVSEADLKAALRDFLATHHLLIEGAAAVVLAAFEKLKPRLTGNIVLVLCGANISLNDLKKVLA